jgi:hypothetical protein
MKLYQRSLVDLLMALLSQLNQWRIQSCWKVKNRKRKIQIISILKVIIEDIHDLLFVMLVKDHLLAEELEGILDLQSDMVKEDIQNLQYGIVVEDQDLLDDILDHLHTLNLQEDILDRYRHVDALRLKRVRAGDE